MRVRRQATWAGGILAGLGVLTLAAGIALAEETKTDGAATQAPAGQTTPSATPATPADQTTAPAATPNATPATPDAKSTPVPIPSGDPAAAQASAAADPLTQIRDQGKKLDAAADKKASAAIDAAVNDVEKNATDGDQKIAERLAGEFGVSTDVLIAEKDGLKVGWGQLMLARTLLANSSTELSTRQLFDLRNEGMSWAQISSGMGLKLGEVLNAAKAEAKVAKGLAKADGKVAVVHGSGSKAGAGSATKTASAKPASAKESSPKVEAQSATPSGAPETAPGK